MYVIVQHTFKRQERNQEHFDNKMMKAMKINIHNIFKQTVN